MFFLKEKPERIVEIRKETPHVGTPFIAGKRSIPCYEHDVAMNWIIGGYSSSDNSYTRELMAKYPLDNE